MDMNQINYIEKDEHFSSNVRYYDKKKQARIAKNGFIDKIGYAPLILCLVLAIPTLVVAIGLLISLFIVDPPMGIICLLLLVSPIIITYMAFKSDI